MKTLLILLVLSCSLVVKAGYTNKDLYNYDDQFHSSAEFMFQNMIRSDIQDGAIIASPSKQSPDYFYHWVRDAALTLESAMDMYEFGYLNPDQRHKMQNFFLNHLLFNKKLQERAQAAEGLGEPKFSVDGYVYPAPWGRPQNDGPALRASSLSRLLAIALNEKWPQIDQIKKFCYESSLKNNSLIKSDLEYTAHHWRDFNFDLWEEVSGSHFYTLMSQRKSLAIGVLIARTFGDLGAADFYGKQLELVNKELEKFWDPNRQFIMATVFVNADQLETSGAVPYNPAGHQSNNRGKSQLDTAVLLAVLHSNLDGGTFSIIDDRVLATFQRLKDSFSSIYTVNGKRSDLGTAFGRYPEDTYNGYDTNGAGNPWVLSTAAAAEYLYKLGMALERQDMIHINSVNQSFFTHSLGFRTLRVGQVVSRHSLEFRSILQRIFHEGDRYITRVMYHRNPDGSLSEQINRDSGYMQGAVNLTWSHASFLTAKMARDKALQALKGYL
jgi:glucoamylase